MQRRGAFPLALSLGAVPWRCAATPGSAISRHAMIAPERSVRSPDDDMAWRGKVEIGDRIVDKDEALQVSGGCEPLDDLLASQRRQMRVLCPVVETLCWRCSTFRPIPVRAAPSEPGLSATITRGVRDYLAVAAAAGHACCHQGAGQPNPCRDHGGATAENRLLVASSAASGSCPCAIVQQVCLVGRD
jgi:hypothetical protein